MTLPFYAALHTWLAVLVCPAALPVVRLMDHGAYRLSGRSPARYQIVGIEMLPGYTSVVAADLNARGDAVLTYAGRHGAYFDTRAVLYRRGRLLDLGASGGDYSEAAGIGRRGEVVGGARARDGAYHAFRWHAGTMQDLGGSVSTKTVAESTNGCGQIVGWSERYPELTSYAWLRTHGVRKELTGLGGDTRALSINDEGQAVGWSATPQGDRHAILWQQGRLIDLGVLPGDHVSEARRINVHGHVVGFSHNERTGIRTAFVYRRGKMRPLGHFADGTNSSACGMNRQGDVVGTADRCPAGGTRRVVAFLWRAGTWVDLNTRIAPQSGWELQEAIAINDAGQILGIGLHNGQIRAFLLSPRRGHYPSRHIQDVLHAK